MSQTERVAFQLIRLAHNFSGLISCAILLLPKMDLVRVLQALNKGHACQDCVLKPLMINKLMMIARNGTLLVSLMAMDV